LSQHANPQEQEKQFGRHFLLLERVTAGVLLLVIASLGWVLLAAEFPEWAEGPAGVVQVACILSLLTAALLLVSVVALMHTR
jgi:hypothetical protein